MLVILSYEATVSVLCTATESPVHLLLGFSRSCLLVWGKGKLSERETKLSTLCVAVPLCFSRLCFNQSTSNFPDQLIQAARSTVDMLEIDTKT